MKSKSFIAVITVLLSAGIQLGCGDSQRDAVDQNPSDQIAPLASQATSQPLTDEELKAALITAYAARYSNSPNEQQFQAEMVKASPRLPTVPVILPDREEAWTKLRLNTLRTRLDAFRFRSPLDGPADLLWAFAYPGKRQYSWFIATSQGRLDGFYDFKQRSHVAIDGLELTEQNDLIVQSLRGGQIQPGIDYFICFSFQNEQPFDLNVKLKLVPADENRFQDRLVDITQELGIATPLKYTSAASFEERVNSLWMDVGPDAALAMIEEEMKKPPVSRSLRRLHASGIERKAISLAESGVRDESGKLFLKVADELARIEADFGQLTAEERDFYSRALYNKACTVALAGQSDTAIESLRTAVKHGFREWQMAEADPDLQSLRGNPMFLSLIGEIKSQK